MADIKIYGIKNCDTMKKAFGWLDQNNVSYEFHDYKKAGVNENVLRQAIEEHGWESVLNRRGTTWRNLSEDTKQGMNDAIAIQVAMENPSIIKRPLLLEGAKTVLGFKEDEYEKICA